MKGYVAEVFSSFQGEGGCVRGSCFGKRQVFIRFAGCNLAEQRTPCVWCDTPAAQKRALGFARVERPGGGGGERLRNPLSTSQVVEIAEALRTPDMHSISLTGGEPLYQEDFLIELCGELDEKVYLETNGTLPEAASRLAGLLDYASVDIKDETALPYPVWPGVLERELETIRVLRDSGVEVFAKVVVTDETAASNLELYARELSKMDVPLAIQPVFDAGGLRLSVQHLQRLSQAAAEYLSAEDITLSIQVHKLCGMR